MSEAPKDRNFVTALARGLDVLRAFRRGETALSNAEIAARTGLPKPTVSRLTHTLCVQGYLTQDSAGGYRLGAGVLRLGFGVLSGLEIGDRAGALMEALRDGPNSYITCALGERHGLDAIYVAVRRSREDVALAMHVGAALPLFRSSMGRAILVALEPERRAALLARAQAAEPDRAGALRESLSRAEAEFGRGGYVTSFGDWRADVNAIAVPVRGARVHGLNLGGPSFHVGRDELEQEYAPRLIEAARALSLTG